MTFDEESREGEDAEEDGGRGEEELVGDGETLEGGGLVEFFPSQGIMVLFRRLSMRGMKLLVLLLMAFNKEFGATASPPVAACGLLLLPPPLVALPLLPVELPPVEPTGRGWLESAI